MGVKLLTNDNINENCNVAESDDSFVEVDNSTPPTKLKQDNNYGTNFEYDKYYDGQTIGT